MSAQRMCEPQARNLDFIRRESIKHESVVRIGAMGNRDFASADGGKAGHYLLLRESGELNRSNHFRDVRACQPRTAPAANMILRTSAKINQ